MLETTRTPKAGNMAMMSLTQTDPQSVAPGNVSAYHGAGSHDHHRPTPPSRAQTMQVFCSEGFELAG